MTNGGKKSWAFYGDADLIAQDILNSDFVFDPDVPEDEVLSDSHRRQAAYILRWWRDDFYHWQDGRWVRLSDAETKRIATEHIQALNDRMSGDDEQQIPISTQRINNVLLCLKGRIGIPEGVGLNSWLDGICREKIYYTIAVNNGLLMIDRRGKDPLYLEKHTPNFFAVTKLPYDYDPKAECPHWLEFLNDVMQGDQKYADLLQQWTGYLFRPDLREQKFLLCTGEGANGKGVFFEVIQELVGNENSSQVGLARFSNPFALYATLGKVVNVTNESSHIIEDEAESILKSFVAGDRFTFERKFKEPVCTVPTAKIMIATNALPRFNDKTQAIWRRILFVPFDKVIPDEVQIKDLAEKLKRELPGILNWALEVLQKLNDASGFTIPEKSKSLLDEYRKDADPARAFLLENCIFSPNGWGISCMELYNQYKQHCEENGYKPMGNRLFGRHVRRVFPEVKRVQTGGRDSREWTYRGLVNQVHQEIPI
jgi:P4 family phage/plasmid primase-like protien